MIHAGLDNVQFDRGVFDIWKHFHDAHTITVLTAEDASLLAMECGLEPVVNEERAFDLYPS